jgi:late competence protein required for DNA uptake (superfamily II DNA/RNA helicase)
LVDLIYISQKQFDGSHVAFFPDWNTAFTVIDEVFEMGVDFVRDKNKRVLKNLETKDDQMKCYRCNNFKNKDLFKWGHIYCNECALEDKKQYYYLNKYEISSNKYFCSKRFLC